MTAQAFGDEHTRKKLETVEKYLGAFTTALKKRDFQLLYVDACAGSGSSISKSAGRATGEGQSGLLPAEPVADTDQIIVGSAIRALGVQPPFDRYLFNDVKPANVRALRAQVKQRFSDLEDRVTITQFDANEMLSKICDRTRWKATRAVVFLDPFGLQIRFETLQKLASTQAVDLWYLVPVFAMYRQVRGDGGVLEDGGRSVDEALGTTDWRHVVAVEEKGQPDLFGVGQSVSKRAVDIAWFENIAKERLKLAFDGRVIDQVLPLGRNGLHEFSLMFAWANPGEKAKLAAKLAAAVLR
ncbi:three-Cys-motif partner protein TcmP [Allosphingosinicella sp.]|uniref:three-Cys-motif partner protein TcmP n=1 Tax=Allosphingosinicella sp. TaxID=2823234 RepID=UPI0037849B48